MPDEPMTSVTIHDFQGLVLNRGRVALPPGAMVTQTNMTNEEDNVLQTRQGLKPVEFDE